MVPLRVCGIIPQTLLFSGGYGYKIRIVKLGLGQVNFRSIELVFELTTKKKSDRLFICISFRSTKRVLILNQYIFKVYFGLK